MAPTTSPTSDGDCLSDFRSMCACAGISHPTLTFIGGGKMTSALVTGFVAAGCVDKKEVAVSVRSNASIARWKELGFENVYTDNEEMLRRHGAGIVLIAVKPQQRERMFEKLSASSLERTSLFVSIMGGVSLTKLEVDTRSKGYTLGVVRLMPNTAASVAASSCVLCASPGVPKPKVDVVACLAEKVGLCREVEEKCFDAASAVAGCGTGYVFAMIEALADGGVLGGMPRATAMTLAAQTVMGAAKMVLESGEHPGKLKDDVCSPGGTTIYGMRELERNGMRSAFIEAVMASTERAKQL